MSDLFHPTVPFEFIDKVFNIIYQCSNHTFQVLTKRINRMADFWGGESGAGFNQDPIPNLWLGVSVSTPDEKWKIEELRKIPAAIRFISFEPLLADMGNVNLEGIHWVIVGCESGPKRRPCDNFWINNIYVQCKNAGVPIFVKQINDINTNKIIKMPKGWPQEYPK